MTSRIMGTGSYLPELAVTNDDLAKIMDTSDEWISSRTGIRQRRLVKDETTAFMASEASKIAIKEAGIRAEEIDLIIVGTITGDYVTPSTACEVQAAIGAINAAAFDVNAACTGFMTALHTAYAYMAAGIYTTALVIGAETLSKIMDWDDRSTCVLFGDGAGAAIVKKDETGLISLVQGSDGEKGLNLCCKNRGNHHPFIEGDLHTYYTEMNGQEVYKFAVTKVPQCIMEVLEQGNVTAEEVKYFILHHANMRISQSVAKRLKVSEDKFPISLDTCGNVSAASIPILLDKVNKEGLLKRGDKLVLAGFGGGLTWGATVIEW